MKNILVSGASRGLGLKVVEKLLTSDFNVFAVSRTLSPELAILIDEYPGRLFHFCHDLTDLSGLKNKIFSDFVSYKTPIHGLVNNAAVAYDDLVSNIQLNQLQDMFNLNVFSPMLISKYVIRNMIFNRVSGSLVHISSICVHTGYKGLAMYAASKGAIEAFSKNTAREWGKIGIRSNCVVPGFMETEMSKTLSQDNKEKIYKRTALQQPTDIQSVAETVLFLLSEKSNSITGQNIFVDSGTI